MKRHVEKLISEALGNMWENGQSAATGFQLNVPKENFGDFTTNVAFSIARANNVNPNEAAETLAREIKSLDSAGFLESVEAKNGFLNVRISKRKLAAFAASLHGKFEVDKIGLKPDGTKTKVVFEYSSPNTNKPLHIGHTRNDVYGMACINLLRETGHDVIACEIINDRGVHIMKSMLMYMKYGNGATPESENEKPDHFVGRYYVMFSEKSAESEQRKQQLEQEAQELLQKWEAGDSGVRKLWKTMNDWWYQGVQKTYAREGSEFDSVEHESAIYDKGRDLILQGVKRGIFQQEEDGSISVDLSGDGLDKKYLVRKDGTTIYITQDVYLWHLRNEKFKPDLAIVTTSSEQAYHFQVLKLLFELLQFPWAQTFQHLPYEHVYLGKSKMSSRAGNTVTADELVDVIKQRVRETMLNSQKIKASVDNGKLVEAIAFAAIKYGYLKYDRNTKIYFDLDQTIAIEGNTGPYLQYTYARIRSVLSKAGAFISAEPSALSEASELSLMRHLMHYNDAVLASAKEFKPNVLCNYLFELSQKFNVFYDQVSILRAETEELKCQRLSLLMSVASVLEHGLRLLGIEAVNEM